jgi:hypothetical protein
MAGCVLRADGERFVPDQFLEGSKLVACAVWHKGEKRSKTRSPNTHSGINIVVSDADDLPSQVDDAILFLKANHDEIVRLRQTPGLDGLVLDFGIARRDVAVQCDSFPSELVRLAAEFDLGLEMSQYPPSE